MKEDQENKPAEQTTHVKALGPERAGQAGDTEDAQHHWGTG